MTADTSAEALAETAMHYTMHHRGDPDAMKSAIVTAIKARDAELANHVVDKHEMVNAEGLLPCPFCGGEATDNYVSITTKWLGCQRCGVSFSFIQKSKSLARWNTRAGSSTPEGFVMVPLEPTEAMIKSGIDAWKNGKFAIVTIYKAMIAAAKAGT